MKRVLVTLAVAGGLFWISQTAAYAQAPNAACNLLPPQERALCNQRINERRAVCDRQPNPQARQACLNSFNQIMARLNNCPRVAPHQRDDCVRSVLGLQPPAPPVAAACNLLPANERAACNQRINDRRAVCAKQTNPQAQQACMNAFNQLVSRLNSCPRVAPAQRDDCVRAALGLRPPATAELTNVRNQLNSLRNRARALCGQLPPAQRPACIRSLYPPAPPTN